MQLLRSLFNPSLKLLVGSGRMLLGTVYLVGERPSNLFLALPVALIATLGIALGVAGFVTSPALLVLGGVAYVLWRLLGPVGQDGTKLRLTAFRRLVARHTVYFLLGLLRRVKPVLVLNFAASWPGYAIVTRREDIRTVLSKPHDFSVQAYDRRMAETTGRFFLGMDPGVARAPNEYETERDLALRCAPGLAHSADAPFKRSDALRVQQIIQKHATQAAENIRSDSEPHGPGRRSFNLVEHIAWLVPVRFVHEYFGAGPTSQVQGGSFDEEEGKFLQETQTASFFLFNFFAASRLRGEAAGAGREVREMLRKRVTERRAATAQAPATASPDESVLDRYLPHADNDFIVRNLAGLASGTLIATIGTFIGVVDRLLSLPRAQREKLNMAVSSGQDSLILAYIREAARFETYPPALYRYAERDILLGGTHIPRGTLVAVVFKSANVDEPVTEPMKFKPGRDASDYMVFGHGLHWCVGRHIAETLLLEMTKVAFSLPNLRRCNSKYGHPWSKPNNLLTKTPKVAEEFFVQRLDLLYDEPPGRADG